MHLIEFKGRNQSKNFNLNLLFQENKTYLMDNHLAASWCCLKQINLDKKYNLFHIYKHYDLLNSQTDLWLQTIDRMNIDLTSITIDELLAIHYHNPHWATTESIQLFSYDN